MRPLHNDAQLDELTSSKWKNVFADVKVPEKQHEKDLRNNMKHLAAVEKQAEKAVNWVDKWVSTRVGKVLECTRNSACLQHLFLLQDLEKLEAQFKVKKDALDVKRRALLEIELKKRGLA